MRQLTAIALTAALSAASYAAEPAHGGDEGAGGLKLFLTSDIGNAIITLIIFVVVILVLGKFAWGPLLKVLQEREAKIHDALVEAKREREEADQLLKRYQEQVDRAREEATAIVEEGKRDAEAVRQRIHSEAREEADRMIERARREIQLATDAAVKALYDRTAELAVGAAGQIIHKELSPADHAGLVKEALDRMAADDARLN